MKKQTSTSEARPPVPRWIVWPGKVLDKISKPAAAAYMRFFFKRPPRPKLKPEHKEWRRKARREWVEVPAVGKRIRVYRWGEGPSKVLVAHGWGGHGTSLWKLIRRLTEEGYQVVAFDAPAHGESPGRSTYMKEFIESILALDRKYGPFDAAIGHSMGGISALNAAGSHGFRPRRLVLVSVPDSIEAIFYKFADALGLSPEVARLNIQYLEDVYGMNIDEIAGSRNAARTRIPVLVIHDCDDKEVPCEDARRIAARLPQGELILTRGLGHRRIIRDPSTLDLIIRYLQKTDDHGKK
ncbi:MAG: alpha/beta fold hydrolase [Chlorobi bacterium]|nr:alpha/beta fold hydrolase [Chlorobiota bacterium]